MSMSPLVRCSGLAVAFAGLILAMCGAGSAQQPQQNLRSYTQFGQSITVWPDENVAEVTCLGCSIHIRGHVHGDVTTVFGNVFVEDQGQVDGDTTAVAGDMRLDKSAKVSGDTTVVGGELRRAAGAQVSGDVTSIGGRMWVPFILLLPFLLMGLFVWLVVCLVRRVMRPAMPAAA